VHGGQFGIPDLILGFEPSSEKFIGVVVPVNVGATDDCTANLHITLRWKACRNAAPLTRMTGASFLVPICR